MTVIRGDAARALMARVRHVQHPPRYAPGLPASPSILAANQLRGSRSGAPFPGVIDGAGAPEKSGRALLEAAPL